MCAYAVWLADVLRQPLALAGALALAACLAGIAGRWGALLQAGLVVAVAAYGAALLERDAFDGRAPLVAAALLAAGELGYTSIEPPARRVWPSTLLVLLLAAGTASVLLAAAGAGSGRVRDLVLGVAAAAGALALVARLAARAR